MAIGVETIMDTSCEVSALTNAPFAHHRRRHPHHLVPATRTASPNSDDEQRLWHSTPTIRQPSTTPAADFESSHTETDFESSPSDSGNRYLSGLKNPGGPAGRLFSQHGRVFDYSPIDSRSSYLGSRPTTPTPTSSAGSHALSVSSDVQAPKKKENMFGRMFKKKGEPIRDSQHSITTPTATPTPKRHSRHLSATSPYMPRTRTQSPTHNRLALRSKTTPCSTPATDFERLPPFTHHIARERAMSTTKHMSTISTDWKSLSAQGASAAIRNSMCIGTGLRNSSFSFGGIRPASQLDADRGVPQLRTQSQFSDGDRVSRASFEEW
ncbi:hypothetical protein BDZ89DRAFT_1127474 [Hymenopellis radicata]|nr:hypothetical protein BDZ89DRAFT_1127474 [Hymenopellis radicata]